MNFSYSQLSMYIRCGEQYRRRYIEGEKIPPAVGLVRGISVHKGAEEGNKFKFATGSDMPKKDLVEVAADAFDSKLREDGVWLTKEEATRKDAVLGEAKDDTVKLAGLFADEVSPTITPEKIELEFDFPFAEHKFRGRIDLVDKIKGLRDLKTSGKSKNQNEIDTSDQLTAYSLGWESLFGSPPPNIVLDILVNTKKAKYQALETKRTHDDIDFFLRRTHAAILGIQKGVFLPADPTAWVCSERFCGYFLTCPYRTKT